MFLTKYLKCLTILIRMVMKANGFLHHSMVLRVWWIWCFNSWSFCLVSIRNVARQFFNLYIKIKYPGSDWNLLLKNLHLCWVCSGYSGSALRSTLCTAMKCEADPSFILSSGVSLLLVYSKYIHRDICLFSFEGLLWGSAFKIGVCSGSALGHCCVLHRPKVYSEQIQKADSCFGMCLLSVTLSLHGCIVVYAIYS